MPKTHYGEHDYRKPACAEYCRMGGENCPFVEHSRLTTENIVRWTDEIQLTSYTADFNGKNTEKNNLDTELKSFDDAEAWYGEINAGRYTCWADGSGFEYDKMSYNVIGPPGSMENIYDIYSYGVEHSALKFSPWNAWIEKFQYDNRFGRVSDTNAESNLFPNVDNPWMFTEYIFKGISEDFTIVEPPIYHPDTLQLINGNLKIANLSDFDNKYAEEDGVVTKNENEENEYEVRQFRQLQNWDELNTIDIFEPFVNPSGALTAAEAIDIYNELMALVERTSTNGQEWITPDAGVKLYRVDVPVESIKWGEHGNIPPGTLNMTAPTDWLDPTKVISKVRPVYVAHVGSPLNAANYGVISWEGKIASINPEVTFVEGVLGSKKCYNYSVENAGIAQSMPKQLIRGDYVIMEPTERVRGVTGKVNYCHGGCALLQGRDNCLRCLKMEQFDVGTDEYNALDGYFVVNYCNAYDGYGATQKEGSVPENKCPHYVGSKEFPVIAMYQAEVKNMSEMWTQLYGFKEASGTVDREIWAENLLNNSTGLPSADMFVAGGFGTQFTMLTRPDAVNYDNTQIYYELTFENAYAPAEPMLLNTDNIQNFGRNVHILPNTGKFAIDSAKNANPFSGGDTNTYDDISVLSFHRFFTPIMHCATQADCNDYCGINQRQGFSAGTKAGGRGECRYWRHSNSSEAKGKHGCPYTGVPKRAVEFGMTMQGIAPMLKTLALSYSELTYLGMWQLDDTDSSETTGTWEVVDGVAIVYDKYAFFRNSHGVTTVLVKSDSTVNIDCSIEWAGAALPLYHNAGSSSSADGISSSSGEGQMLSETGFNHVLCKFKTSHEVIKKFSTLQGKDVDIDTYTISDIFFWYQPLDDEGNTITASEKHHVDKNGYWLCKSDDNYVMPSYNAVIIDNEEKFIGGYHPQYKDYTKMGPEFLMDVEVEVDRAANAMGDYNPNDPDYTSMPSPMQKKGYWTDASGVYITDERPTGFTEKIATDDERAENSGHGVCISYKKSNTMIDMQTGKREAPKVTNGAVFSNDPYDLVITTFRAARNFDSETMELTGRPMLLDDSSGEDKPYYAPVYISQPYLLPTMRKALRCPICDYYIAFRYHEANCPWCNSEFELITGDIGEGLEEGDFWPKTANVIKKFLKINAIGMVQVWAPPGTCIDNSAYFWRNQALVSNGIRRQIYHRLGDSNKEENGGGWKFNKMSPQSEMTLGFPESVGVFNKPSAELSKTKMGRFSRQYVGWDDTMDSDIEAMYNAVSPRHMIPGFYNTSKRNANSQVNMYDNKYVFEDEGLIAPYTSDSNDALKMASYEQLRVLRNAIEPVFAYSSENISQNDYPLLRASFEKREEQTSPIIYQNRMARISPVVLAAVDTGRDAFQAYYSGDLVYGVVREYYPPGYTWWFLKQVLGGRYSNCTAGAYHMDGGGGVGHMCIWPVTPRTVSKCAIFLHGMLPLDKDIIKAYLIISPSEINPSKDPVGRAWNMGPVMYHHYHAFPKDHFGDGTEQHLHGTAGYPPGTYFDDEGQWVDTRGGGIHYADLSDYRLWGRDTIKPNENIGWYDNQAFLTTMTNLPGMLDTTFFHHVGTEKTEIKDGETVKGYGYVRDSFPEIAGFQMVNLGNNEEKDEAKYQYIYINADGDIVQQYSNSMIWKTTSKETIENSIEKYTAKVSFGASDGTVENSTSYTFTQSDRTLINDIMPNQQQEITGYFDMSWTNTTGIIYGGYTVQSNLGTPWEEPVIFQSEATVTPSADFSAESYTGSTAIEQIGNTSRLLDVTNIVKSLYNNRIDRNFSCQAGASLTLVSGYTFPSTQIGGSLPYLDYDVEKQNTQTKKDNYGYKLNDMYSYPKLESDNSLPAVSSDGDKYELAVHDNELICQMLFPMTIDDNNKYYSVRYGEVGTEYDVKTIPVGTIETIEEALTILADIFDMSNLTIVSLTEISVVSYLDVNIDHVDNSCYTAFGLADGKYLAGQSRVITVSNFANGYHPRNLSDSESAGWIFNAYENTTQNAVIDLCRAPSCTEQRNWRYSEPTLDYSNCLCPTDGCQASGIPCSVAANLANKVWDNSSGICPFGHSLADAKGVSGVAGDGIMTYSYDAPFNSNPFITKIVAEPRGCSYRVSIKNSEHDNWTTVLDVTYFSQSEEYYENHPTPQLLEDDVRTIAFDKEYAPRARYIQVQCDAEPTPMLHEYDIVSASNYSIVVTGYFKDLSAISLAGIQANIDDAYYATIVSSNISEDYTTMTIALDRDIFNIASEEASSSSSSEASSSSSSEGELVFEKLKFTVNKYYGGMKQLGIYGFHYMTSSSASNGMYLTITDVEDEFYQMADTKTTKYTLSDVPTQINRVQMGTSGGAGAVLTEAANVAYLKWRTEEITLKDNANEYTIKRITGGNYYHDPQKNAIYIPEQDQDGDKWGTFEDAIIGKGIIKSFLPTRLIIKGWSGNGKTIELEAQAEGNGPSYMIEKDSIQYIVNASALPSNGVTCKMVAVTTGAVINKNPIDWTCYNTIPSTLDFERQSRTNKIYPGGEFGKPPLNGSEIKADVDNDQSFVDLFGDHCELCMGKCKTKVAFTGAPNKVLSGSILVRAKAITEKTVSIDANTNMKISERTGGLNSGIIIVKCHPVDAGAGRVTLTYNIPTLLIYAKERKIFAIDNVTSAATSA